MISFSKKRCKGTTFCAHSQIKCTKTAFMCTNLVFCAKFINREVLFVQVCLHFFPVDLCHLNRLAVIGGSHLPVFEVETDNNPVFYP